MGSSAILFIISFTWQGLPNPHYDRTTIKTCERIELVENKSDQLSQYNYAKEEDYYCIKLYKSK